VMASLVMTAVLIIIIRSGRTRGGLLYGITFLIATSAFIAFISTAPPLGSTSDVPYVITTGPAVAAMAYVATFGLVCLVQVARAFPRIMGKTPRAAPAGTGAQLLTALIGPCEKGWDVSWTGAGRGLPRLTAATLTEVADQATAAAAQYYSSRPAQTADSEFQIALFPYYYTKGPIFDISGGPGAFTATDKTSVRELHGATLEDLLRAASASDLQAGKYMFHWTRPVTALPTGTSAPGLEPAS
jgi:hypothetical protein